METIYLLSGKLMQSDCPARKGKMPTVWAALKKSLNCKSGDSCGVIERANSKSHGGASITAGKKSSSSSAAATAAAARLRRSGCSRSIANLRDVIHSRRQDAAAATVAGEGCGSPMSIGSNDVLNPVTHDVLLAAGGPDAAMRELRIGTPGRGGPYSPLLLRCSTTPVVSTRKSPSTMSPLRTAGAAVTDTDDDDDTPSPAPARSSCDVGVRCHRCGDRFSTLDALDSHHLSLHAVTELVEGESSRKVVEIICKAGWPKSENPPCHRVLKVHNAASSVSRFEEFRETVKSRAAKLTTTKRHPRCLADGNELLRFHATTLSCSLAGAGAGGGVCASGNGCGVCRIIRHGFSAARDVKDGVGVFTTSTSKRALDDCVAAGDGEVEAGVRKALLVCRVVAGRIHRPLDNLQEAVATAAAQPGFDSVAGKVGDYGSIEELYLLNPRALLPCFVVVCKA
uniref:C2H2-type domain-containing protein n=1 Tax=Leersia perrieri TaxID=77586 RepID=A0A0D9WTC4_9ORYZ